MRVLIGPPGLEGLDGHGGELDDLDESGLAAAYASPPGESWLRVNMVATVDGAATGESGLTASINNAADKRVFDVLRALADVIVVGAGTARAEGYAPVDRPTVLVSRRAEVPQALRGAAPGAVRMATVGTAEHLDEARSLLGDEHVLVLGSHRVDLALLRRRLVADGHRQILSEGGPHLLRDLMDQGVADELDATVVPRLIGGEHARMTNGPPVDVPLRLHALLEDGGTLLARWLT